MSHYLQPHPRTLDPYLVAEKPTKNNVILVNLNLVNVCPPIETPRRTFGCKVEALVGVMHDLQGLEGYARRDRVFMELVMMSVVDTEEEMAQLMRIAHSTGRIKEQGTTNGAWVTASK